jgi:peptide-methionine (S)-S-oxide reductase
MVISLIKFIVIILLSLITLTQTYIVYADNESKGSNIDNKEIEKAVFAGGCFWCMQNPYDELKGVVSTAVGYTGGNKITLLMRRVCAGKHRTC